MTFPNLSEYCYFNTVFDQYPVQFAYYIISTYMFLNVAALPVLTITLRMNLMKLVTPHLVPKKSFEVTKASFIYTLFIVLPVVGLAMRRLFSLNI